MKLLRVLERETLGIEPFGPLPQRLVAMHDVDEIEGEIALLHLHIAKVDVFRRHTVDQRHGRIKPHRLLDNLLVVDEIVDHRGVDRLVATDVKHLTQQPFLHVGRVGDEIEREGERECGGLVAGADERHDIVAQFGVGEAPARFGVARGEQQAEQILLLAARCAAALDRVHR